MRKALNREVKKKIIRKNITILHPEDIYNFLETYRLSKLNQKKQMT